jgi:peptidoglycan hydrolase-like protein with peptidoglycan-binding domain
MINESNQSEQKTTEVSTTSTVLSQGDTGEAVANLQESLNEHGASLNQDGLFGSDTDRAVRNFQQSNDLVVDGIVGPATEEKLENKRTTTESRDTTNGEVTVTESSSNLSQGDEGEAVSNLQESLNTYGANLSEDGIFGSSTDRAVRDFQESNALAVDGIAGPATLEALSASPQTATEDTEGVIIEEAPQQETKSVTVESTSAPSNSDVVSTAKNLVGSAYVPGGTTPAGFDSSGFINYVFEQAGISLDRTHQGMWDNNGVHVDNPQVGDVVFFTDTYNADDGRYVTHSGIYIGNNQMVHAGTSSSGVNIADISIDYWASKYIGAKSFQ